MFVLRGLFKTSIILGLFMPMAAQAGPFSRSTQLPASTAQQISQPTLAPEGFLAFCKRNPDECAPAASPSAPAETSTFAAAVLTGLDSQEDFGTIVSHTVTAASRPTPMNTWSMSDSSWWTTPSYFAAGRDMFVPKARLGRSATVNAPVRIDVTSAISELQTMRRPLAPVAVAPEGGPVLLGSDFWTEVEAINRQVNKAIVYRSDTSEHGKSEVWSRPLAEGRSTGDCEDYVLEKRHALIAAGVPMRALSIAVVRTFRGETHAVLLLDTDQGEYVLDSLSSKIQPWKKTGYEWRERQIAGSMTSWAMVADPRNQAPTRNRRPAILLASLN